MALRAFEQEKLGGLSHPVGKAVAPALSSVGLEPTQRWERGRGLTLYLAAGLFRCFLVRLRHPIPRLGSRPSLTLNKKGPPCQYALCIYFIESDRRRWLGGIFIALCVNIQREIFFMNDSSQVAPSFRLGYSPKVTVNRVDLAIALGSYRLMFAGGEGLDSLGLVRYPHLMCALDSGEHEVLFVCAETNPFGGPEEVHLGVFDGMGHATLGKSAALAIPQFFLAVACAVARDRLGMSRADFPPADVESGATEGAARVAKHVFEGAELDADTTRMLELIWRVAA
jgi:hypothetical protein